MFLIRILLVGLIVYLIVRAFSQMGEVKAPPSRKQEPAKKDNKIKGVPREIGEYIDYEEMKD